MGMLESVAGASMAMSQTQLMTNISTQVLAKSLDSMQESVSGLIDMLERSVMENSVMPNLGGNIDLMA